jgi:hypothetical protein
VNSQKQLEKTFFERVIQYLERKEESEPGWKLHLGRESMTADELIKRLKKDAQFRAEIHAWADILAIDMFEKGRQSIEGNSNQTPV